MIVRFGFDFRKKLGDSGLVNARVLPKVEACQLKPETVDGTAQEAQVSARQQLRPILHQGTMDNVEIARQLSRTFVGGSRSVSDPRHWRPVQPPLCRREPCKHMGDSPPVRL